MLLQCNIAMQCYILTDQKKDFPGKEKCLKLNGKNKANYFVLTFY